MLRKQFHLCLKIGRDLVRLLQDLVHIPEFRAIWKDLVLNPSEFKTDGFIDISQLYLASPACVLFFGFIPEMELHLEIFAHSCQAW
ncbi:hypothetical protein Leryth_026871 [Lithospermum erythrorhizon]|nr:hypothetical protein Leryth_026871 [Lithospermum erythrorhizon]